MNSKKLVILYSRLSRDDEINGTSNSIVNQQQLLQEYAERNNLVPFLHIQDDGYSGTNWDRPGWQELITKVEADEVACVCIKDSSRLGRDYLRAGLYREMFRDKNVRLIMVNDGFDSSLGEDDFTPFREIMAEWYARDTSKKIKSVVAAKGNSGKPITTNPPYGFIKDPNDKNKWLVDPEAANIVRRIFQMTVDGMGIFTIAGILTRDKVERPSFHLGSRGLGIHKNCYNRDDPYTWSDGIIAKILRSPEYAGHTVNFRSTAISFKSKKRKLNAPEEWLIFPNTHEAIVDQATFDMVQKLRETPRRTDTLGEANPLTGLLWCADCGAKMYNHRRSRPNKPTYTKATDNYNCSNHKLSKRKSERECTAHFINTDAVRDIILTSIRATASYVRNYEQDFIERIRESSAVKQGETAKTYQKQIVKNERRLSEIDRIYKSLYEDKALGKITEDVFSQMTEGYQLERVALRKKNDAMQSELGEFNDDSMKADKFIDIVRRYTSFDVLTTAMMHEFIDKVVVHEGVWSDGSTGKNSRPRGTRTQQVDIFLKYIGRLALPDMRSAEEIEAERIIDEKREARRTYNRQKTLEYRERKRTAEAATLGANDLVPVALPVSL